MRLLEILADKEAGRPYSEEEVTNQACLAGLVTLVASGVDEETALKIIESAVDKGSLRVSFSMEEGLTVQIGEIEADSQ